MGMMMYYLMLCMVACTMVSANSLRLNEDQMKTADLPWTFLDVIKLALNKIKKISETDVTCYGGRSYCPTGNTCCLISDYTYGCCPAPNAVCCEDRINCCPNGYICSENGCTKSDYPFYSKIAAWRIQATNLDE